MEDHDPAGRYSDDIQAEVSAANREGREVELTPAQMRWLGHGKRSPMKVIRRFCIDCMGNQPSMVRKCTSAGCALWPYRLGRNPYHAASTGFSEPAADRPMPDERGPSTSKTPQPTGGLQSPLQRTRSGGSL